MNLGRFAGIQIKLNIFFLLVFCLTVWFDKLREMVIVFCLVLFHEIFHILEARVHGLTVAEIELLPFGGVTRIQETIEINPDVEARIAVAGPFASIFLALCFYLFQRYSGMPLEQNLYNMLFGGNLFIAFFNFLPAFPLDGGRLYRAFLLRNSGYKTATMRAVFLSKFIALLLCLFNIIMFLRGHVDPAPFIVGLLIYYAALKEQEFSSYVLLRYLMRKKAQIARKRVSKVEHYVVLEDSLIKDVLQQVSPGTFRLFIVLTEELNVMGIITEVDLLNFFFKNGPMFKIADILKKV